MNIKIGDFGLSCLAGDGKSLKTSCGSPNYAAPELLSGERYDGCSADMWSTGVILFASLMGTLPFDSACMATLFEKIRRVTYHIPRMQDKISPEARDLIVRLLQPNPVKHLTAKKSSITHGKYIKIYLHASV
jgi:serine/threonine protein kinase